MSVDYLPFEHAPSSKPRGIRWQRVALVFVCLWFFFGGLAHFVATDLEMRAVPPAITWPREAVLISGFFELLGALGLVFKRTRRAAGWGLFLLTVAVTPANVYMLDAHERFDIPEWLLFVRLPMQVVVLWLIVWGSRWRPVRRLY